MAAPAITPRQVPSGIKMDDGFRSTIAFSLKPAVCFWEESVKPPGEDGGDPINTTTMHNTERETMAPQALKKTTEATASVAYDPLLYTQILDLVNKRGSVTNQFPDGTTVSYYGYLQKFEPTELKRGAMPLANITVIPTNYDPVNHVEVGPLVAAVAGT